MNMMKRILLLVMLMMMAALTVQAAGFEPGALIRAVEKNGEEIKGTLMKFEANPEISLLDKSGHYFKLQLKNVRRISGVAGQTVMTGGGSSLNVLKFDMVNGPSVSAGLSSNAIVKIDMGVKGQRNIWITDYAKYKYVEVIDREAAGPGNGYMKVRLLDGQIIRVPVKKADVHSILFE
jgi:hypothetical protein